jgi:serine/threonine-protein kinase
MGEFANLLGRVVAGKFAIEEHVGGGAMGEVFRGRHVVLDTVVALKVMRPDIAKDPMFKERFYREAKLASRLDHPNSVRVIDFGVEPDGLVYLAMEFLHGRHLLSVLREEWPLPDERVVDILAQTLAAVAVAHDLGIVHRDLKPENIMVSVGHEEDGVRPYHVKVCDFGIAKLNDPRGFSTDSGKALTSSGTLIGTPEYMSPEQARGDTLDARSDLYSVGIMLYQLLVGRVPFSAENALGVVLKQVTDEPVPPSQLRPGVNARLEAICLRALKKPREERYQSAKAMRRDLRGVFGYRPQSMTEESANLPAVAPSASDMSSAPTVVHSDVPASESSGAGLSSADRSEPRAASSAKHVAGDPDGPDFGPKQTSDGTELTVPVTMSPRYLGAVVGVAALALLVGGGAVAFFGRTSGTSSGSPFASASASSAASLDPSAGFAAGGAVPLVGSAPSVALGAPSAAARRGAAGAKPTTTAPVASARGASPVAPSGGAALGASPPITPGVAAAASAGAGAGAASSAAAPPYDPAGAYVAFGAITPDRVREDVIRRKMSELAPRLSGCYRDALMMAGAPVPGSAEIHMSIDSAGNMTSIVSAPKHPSFARCAQQVLAGQKVPVSALESGGEGGANATQWLTLRP